MRLRAAVGALTVAAVLVGAAHESDAIVNGTPDNAEYPFVGAVDVTPTGRRIPASGVLISPTVLLTAGHVAQFFTDQGLTQARVTFDPVFNADTGTFHAGAIHVNPLFSGQPNDQNDMAVIVFAQPIDVTPAELPSENYLDGLHPQQLQSHSYPAVGYGISRMLGGRNGGGPLAIDRSSAGTRRVGTWSFLSLSQDWIRFDMGDQQGCTGDSGAPNFLSNSTLVLGIGISGDGACQAMGSDIRLDTPATRAFLASFVRVP